VIKSPAASVREKIALPLTARLKAETRAAMRTLSHPRVGFLPLFVGQVSR